MGLRAISFINFVFIPEAVNYIFLRANDVNPQNIYALEPSTEPSYCTMVESCRNTHLSPGRAGILY